MMRQSGWIVLATLGLLGGVSAEAQTLPPSGSSGPSPGTSAAPAPGPRLVTPQGQPVTPQGQTGWTTCPSGGCWQPEESGWSRWWRHCHECFLGLDEEFISPPLGASVYALGNIQVANGEASRMFLYQFDFGPGTDRLTPRGKQQLAKIATLLDHNVFPIVVEETPNTSGLDDARRLAVLQELASHSIKVPAARVVVGQPVAQGIRGAEAEIIYQNLLQQTQSAGTKGSTLSNGGGGFAPSH